MPQGQSSGRLVIVVKGFVKLPNLHTLLKQKSSSLSRNLALGAFGKLVIVFLTEVNLLGGVVQRCCLLHLTKQVVLKTFLRTLIFMTSVSLYMFFLLELI